MELVGIIKNAQKRISGFWAIEVDSFEYIKKLYSNFEKNPKDFIVEMNSKKESKEDEPKAGGDTCGMEAEEVLSVSEGVATITIRGPLVDSHDCATIFFGCTSYEDINEAIKSIKKDNTIEKVIFDIDSPGGMVSGCDNCSQHIRSIEIPTEARVSDLAASAAYWLATQCDTIVATSLTARFGSIGVVIEYWDGTKAMENRGYQKVTLLSTGAPNKRLDALTDEGARKIVQELDEIENIFIRRVAKGRKTTESIVRANFGQGGTFLSEKSISVGMVDSLEIVGENNRGNQDTKISVEEINMNLSEYLKENPEAKTEIDGMITDASEKAVAAALEKVNKEKTEESESEKNKANKEKAKTYLTSEYPNSIKNLAADVISGEKSFDALEAAVSAYDEAKEGKKAGEAAEESGKPGETPSEEVTTTKGDGMITDEDSFQEQKERLKKSV